MKFIIQLILLIIIFINLYEFKSVKKDTTINNTEINDLHCKQIDFETKLNITVGNNITVIYNSSLCKKCLQKLMLFRALQKRFELASFNELTFIMLTTEFYGTTQFREYQNRAGNIQIISIHDIINEFFVPRSFYIFDKCSRLTYELTSSPSSEVQNQVVKAAILSTWFDSPCGVCALDGIDSVFDSEDNYVAYEEIDEDTRNPEMNIINETTDIFRNISFDIVDSMNEEYTENNQEDKSYLIPLKIVIPSEHVHLDNSSESGTYLKYNFFILNSNDSFYHEHLLNDIPELLYGYDIINKSNSENNNSTMMIDDAKLTNQEGLNFEIVRNYNVLDKDDNTVIEYQEIRPIKTATTVTNPTIDENSEKEFRNVKDSSSIYTALHPWLSFRLRQGTV